MTPVGILLLILGIVLVLASVVLLFLPYGQKYKTTTQKFSGLGISLEISLLTLLALLGICLALVPQLMPLYWEVNKKDGEIKEAKSVTETLKKENEGLKGQIVSLEQRLAKTGKLDVWALLTLDGVTEQDRPNLADLECTYLLFSERGPVKATMEAGVTANQMRVLLTNIDRQTVVQRLVVEERGKRRWVYENFVPMEPTFVMKKER